MFFFILDFPLESICILGTVTVEKLLTFIKKNNKTFCPSEASDLKYFDPEQMENLAEYYCDLVNCFYLNLKISSYVKNCFCQAIA